MRRTEKLGIRGATSPRLAEHHTLGRPKFSFGSRGRSLFLRIQFDVMRYLTDRAFGKPTQQVVGKMDSPIVFKWQTDDETA
jgi:hypothetical protein